MIIISSLGVRQQSQCISNSVHSLIQTLPKLKLKTYTKYYYLKIHPSIRFCRHLALTHTRSPPAHVLVIEQPDVRTVFRERDARRVLDEHLGQEHDRAVEMVAPLGDCLGAGNVREVRLAEPLKPVTVLADQVLRVVGDVLREQLLQQALLRVLADQKIIQVTEPFW